MDIKRNIPGAQDVSHLEPPPPPLLLLCWHLLAFVGLSWLLLACVCCCWPSLAYIGCCWPLLAVVGLHRTVLAHLQVDNQIECLKKDLKKTYLGLKTFRVSSPPSLAAALPAFVGIRGPELAVVGQCWPSSALVSLCWCLGLAQQWQETQPK